METKSSFVIKSHSKQIRPTEINTEMALEWCEFWTKFENWVVSDANRVMDYEKTTN